MKGVPSADGGGCSTRNIRIPQPPSLATLRDTPFTEGSLGSDDFNLRFTILIRQHLSAFGAPSRQDFAPVSGLHSLSEAMFFLPLPFFRLICPYHFLHLSFYIPAIFICYLNAPRLLKNATYLLYTIIYEIVK